MSSFPDGYIHTVETVELIAYHHFLPETDFGGNPVKPSRVITQL